MEKAGLPPYTEQPLHGAHPAWMQRKIRKSRGLRFIGLAALAFIVYAQWKQIPSSGSSPSSDEITANGLSVKKLQEDIATCAKLRSKPTNPIGLGREKNARYIDGHKPTLVKNATVWVGEPVKGTSAADARQGKGWSWISADVYLEYGLIKRVEKDISLSSLSDDVLVYEAKGRPLTAGIIDMHSHAGVYGLPSLWGTGDGNEMSSDITPYARSIDAIQPDDYQIQVIKSGGVTTSLVLPGSGNNMGGEAYAIKHAVGKADGRNETSATDMLADPEQNWRFMKMACGENAKRVYGKIGRGPFSRMGESWEFRHAFEQASALVREQDDWCSAADLGVENVKGYLPQELKWESLGALLRGQVHLNTHCYTIPDLEAFVDHTNEFKFVVRAFHHAHQTYIVPEILKRAYGGDAPASAIFANTMWYKAESYVGTPYAGKHLYDENLTTIYVSDNPVLNAQHVVFEAAKGYKYGLPYHAALAAVTSAPAERMGFAERLGKIKPGYDADVVVWDSDPLSVGAAPVQVWIDGTAQFEDAFELEKPAPEVIVPDLSLAEISEEEPTAQKAVVYTGISKVLLDTDVKLEKLETYNAVLTDGKISCLGACLSEVQAAKKDKDVKVIDLKNGYLVPSFVAFGSMLGLNAIDSEDSTADGPNTNVFSRAADGLALDTKKINVAHKWGVTRAITAPVYTGTGTHHGVSVGFLTGAGTALESGAVFADDVAVHYTLDQTAKEATNIPSISAAVGALRHKLLEAVSNLNETVKDPFSEAAYLRKVVQGDLPLVLTVQSADTIAALLKVKATVEAAIAAAATSKPAGLRVAIYGGAESHLVASELAAAGVGVILAPFLSCRKAWEERRALVGAPLQNGTAVDALLAAGVRTALGVEQDWVVYDLALYAGIAYRNGGGRVDEKQALGLVGRNVFEMLGLQGKKADEEHFVVYEGSPLEIGSRIRAVGGGKGFVSVFE